VLRCGTVSAVGEYTTGIMSPMMLNHEIRTGPGVSSPRPAIVRDCGGLIPAMFSVQFTALRSVGLYLLELHIVIYQNRGLSFWDSSYPIVHRKLET